MKIGLDLDFTITEMPEFFSIMTHALIKSDHEVHIITYRGEEYKEATLNELSEMKINYTRLHIMKRGDNRSAHAWKSELATELKLDAMFEDSPENLHAMPPHVKRFLVCDPEIIKLPRLYERPTHAGWSGWHENDDD